MKKNLAPRTTQGAQPSIKSALARKEAIWRVDMAIRRFFYGAYIPINAINSFCDAPFPGVPLTTRQPADNRGC